VIERESSTRDRNEKGKKGELKHSAHTGELVPYARCEEYLCKVKQKRKS